MWRYVSGFGHSGDQCKLGGFAQLFRALDGDNTFDHFSYACHVHREIKQPNACIYTVRRRETSTYGCACGLHEPGPLTDPRVNDVP